jgi:hypothetical protein
MANCWKLWYLMVVNLNLNCVKLWYQVVSKSNVREW